MPPAFHSHPWVYRAVRVIVDALVGVPLRIYTGTEDQPTAQTSGDWYRLFTDPTPEMTRGEMLALTLQYLLLPGGECFWILYNKSGKPVGPQELPRYAWPVSGKAFKEIEDRDTGRLIAWEQALPNSTKVRRDLTQVVHLRHTVDPDKPCRGMSPIDAAMRSVRTDHKAQKSNEALLDNGAEPGGILTTVGKDGSRAMLTSEQQKAIRDQWEDRHRGAGKKGRVAVVDGLSWQQMGMSPKDMEYQAQREWSRQEIAAAYGVPLFLLTVLGDVHRETSREALKLFYEGTVMPLARSIEWTLERDLFGSRGGGKELAAIKPGEATVWAEWDFSQVKALQRDEAERADIATKFFGIGATFKDLNEHMDLNLPRHEGDDVPMVSSGYQPLVLAVDPPPPPPPPVPPDNPPPDNGDSADSGDAPPDEPPPGKSAPAIHTRARPAEREIRWRAYVARVQAPGEKRMRSAYLSWMRSVRRDVLSWLGGERSRADPLLTTDQVQAFLEEHARRWGEAIESKTRPITVSVVESQLQRLSEEFRLEVLPTDPRILQKIDEIQAAKVVQTPQTIKRYISAQLIEGMGKGENLTQLQNRVRLVMNASSQRSLTIARTESGFAAQSAQYQAFGAAGIERHSWLSAGDEATTRPDHLAEDSHIVRVGETFPVTGLHHPLEFGGPAEQVINCRCDAIPED